MTDPRFKSIKDIEARWRATVTGMTSWCGSMANFLDRIPVQRRTKAQITSLDLYNRIILPHLVNKRVNGTMKFQASIKNVPQWTTPGTIDYNFPTEYAPALGYFLGGACIVDTTAHGKNFYMALLALYGKWITEAFTTSKGNNETCVFPTAQPSVGHITLILDDAGSVQRCILSATPTEADPLSTCDDNRRSCAIYAVPPLGNGDVDLTTAFHTVQGSGTLARKQQQLLSGQPNQTIYWECPNRGDLKFSAGDWGGCGEVMSFVTLKKTVLDGTICGPWETRIVGKAFIVAQKAKTFQDENINKVIANIEFIEPCVNCQWMILEIVKGLDRKWQQDVFNKYKAGNWGKLPDTMAADNPNTH